MGIINGKKGKVEKRPEKCHVMREGKRGGKRLWLRRSPRATNWKNYSLRRHTKEKLTGGRAEKGGGGMNAIIDKKNMSETGGVVTGFEKQKRKHECSKTLKGTHMR